MTTIKACNIGDQFGWPFLALYEPAAYSQRPGKSCAELSHDA
jgi:hypothetical protein